MLLAGIALLCASVSQAEVILQYFNTDYQELMLKMPELVEVGYEALWLPPPTKASGGLSTGYDCWDPFDLGSKNQSGSVRTKYGTDGELRELIRTAHRFGLRVYVDNIMNHRAFSVPGYNAGTPIDIYPGMVPEDFHLRVTEEGFYRKWDNVADWSDTWQIQNRNFSDLIDIAQETDYWQNSTDNGNHGQTEGDHIPKIELVRHPNNPEYYCFLPGGWSGEYPGDHVGVYVGFGSTSITAQVIADNPDFYKENVNKYLERAVRWLVHHTRIDGLRLDAVKHVPVDFFGRRGGEDKNGYGSGYCGQAQIQYNRTRGFNDVDNHRDSVFDPDRVGGRNDLMMFGEHLGEPPPTSEYVDSGMRLVDSRLHSFLNSNLGSPWGSVANLQYEGGEGFAWDQGVTYVKSHDDDYATRPELQFALELTRRGLPCVYTDGNYQSETLGESGGAFPRHANINFLGQWGDDKIPNLVYIHNHFARGWQSPRYGDGDVAAYDRIDKRENESMSDADGTVMFFVMNDNYSDGQYREIWTSFPANSWLWQYSTGGGNFYHQVDGNGYIKVITPPGGYFAFSWRSPEESDLWSGPGGNPITIQENGKNVGWISYVREDGPDGDPGFNPYGVADDDTTDFAYTYYVPRITNPTNVRFAVRADGSAANVLLKLGGGIDINGIAHGGGDMRDHPPGNGGSTAVFEGYESVDFIQRQYAEKFAAADTTRNTIGSMGSESYVTVIGTNGVTVNPGAGPNDYDGTYTAEWIFHDPNSTNDTGLSQFWSGGADATNYLWVKVGYELDITSNCVYYTTDGQSWPEGAGGEGIGNTQVATLQYHHKDAGDPTAEWWTGTLPPLPADTELRYKISGFKVQNGTNGIPQVPWHVPFPNDEGSIGLKKSMMGVWEKKDLDLTSLTYYPHNDFDVSTVSTGLVEGFQVVRARAFLQRDNRASIYNTFTQPFYYDAQTPEGQIVWPGQGDSLSDNRYGCVVHADRTTTAVYYHIDDANSQNDDGRTGRDYGNGTNAMGEVAWSEATQVSVGTNLAMTTTTEWRFDYENIPTNSPATIYVKLAELSSSTNPALDAVTGHFTVLTNTVTANGPDYSMFVAYPQNDGDTVTLPYSMKVWFSTALADGIDTNTLNDRFLIKLDDRAQDRGKHHYNWGAGGNGMHELQFPLPDLYDGDPDKLHEIEVTHTDAGGSDITLTATRLYRAAETEKGPYVDIVTPPEFDSDGKPYEIILPDVANPTPEQRSFTIRVETDLQALHCWIEFTNSVGVAVPYESTTNALTSTAAATSGTNLVVGEQMMLTGSVSVNYSNTTVTGSGTLFDSELDVGNRVRISSNSVVTVTNIASDTSLSISDPYMAGSETNVSAHLQSAFDSELNIGSRVLIDGNVLNVETIGSSSNFTTTADYPGTTTNGVTVYRIDGNPTVDGNRQNWDFLWTNMTAGKFTFYAYVNTSAADTSEKSAYAVRNTTVILREQVPPDPNDNDDDDDGLSDANEGTPEELPETNPETWVNGEVHVWRVFGRTDPTLPDTDGDLLPDGLESGWRTADTNMTDVTADTNGDGFPNFIADEDPPFYNTVPDNGPNGYNLPEYVFNDSRTKLIHGTMTDPQNPDSDYDGIIDGIEDWNRNGWVDGDGTNLPPTWDPWRERDWPDGEWDTLWTETDPNNGDTDGDGAQDGWGEDTNFNGWIEGDVDSNRVWSAGELWLETDPLNPDTDGDLLPDGWEKQYSFDPFDDGITGHTNMSTGAVNSGDPEHGASGNPDNDFIIEGGETNEYTNIMEFNNGTNPRVPNSLEPPPDGAIVIGPGEPIGIIIGITNHQEFTDWTLDDCLVLDEYEGDGGNNQQGDLYLGWDGWDTSRDIVAFYAHDGGDPSVGDGNFYFRIDFHDLRPLAEEENLDLYVVIDTGNTGQGEVALPDEVDTKTEMKWEAVVAVYKSSQGAVYVDESPGNNTTDVGQDLYSTGVVRRDQNAANGFIDAYFNSELDAVEFAISRQALRDAGWNGSGASNFNYQVFTTKDGTQNDGTGAGDIGGRSDIRDAIYNDGIAEDYWQSQQGLESILKHWIPGTSRAGRAKVSVVLHGNQTILPGSEIQNLVNTGSGAGYYRPLDVHEVYEQALNMHITPTLASAIEWAAVDPGAGKAWRDGPALNDKIAELVETNIVDLLGSTFSDHMLPYFTTEYNQDNEELARQYLGRIYGYDRDVSSTVFWAPERLLDNDVFGKIKDMSYYFTVLDQNTHMFNWFGRTESLIEAGYRMNEINGVKCFVINDIATSYLFSNTDGGVSTSLRSLFSRKARSGVQDQVITMASNWETFTDNDDSDAYDANVRWIANRPWVHLVTLEQIAAGEVDVTGDDTGDYWYAYPRGTPTEAGDKQAHNWLNHASQENYDNWYVGQANTEESLQNTMFEIRPGQSLPTAYGMLYTTGVVWDAWSEVTGVADTNLANLARATMHASTFQTAFHNEDNHDLRRYSTGAYMYPATSSNSLASFALNSQAQTRFAAVFERVDDWRAIAASLETTVTASEDIDLDGENEYLLYNSRLFVLFERIGGRIIGVWVRDIVNDQVWQAVGNFAGYAARETELEGQYNVESNGVVVAHRTSCLKDWWASPADTAAYINDLYAFTSISNGWQAQSGDANITKSVTLAPGSRQMEVAYSLSGGVNSLYIRNGLSPNLEDLLMNGQGTLGAVMNDGAVVSLVNTNYGPYVSAFIGYGDGSHNANLNAGAVDDDPGKSVEFDTINMRNQAQTHQVEIYGDQANFSFSLGFQAGHSDWDGDGIPNSYEDGHGFLNPTNAADGALDQDGDGSSNRDEYVGGTGPNSSGDFLHANQISATSTGIVVRFPARVGREYRIHYDDALIVAPGWSNATPTPISVFSDGDYEWVDDGSTTDPNPFNATSRYYRIDVELIE